MADKTIGDLPKALDLYDDSLLVIEQNKEAMRIDGSQIRGFAKEAGAEDVQRAIDAADRAEKSAGAAKSDADRAQELRDSIELDYTYIDTAKDEAQTAAEQAGQYAENAKTSEDAASESAGQAASSAESAAGSVKVVEDNAEAIQLVKDNLDDIKGAPAAAESAKSNAASAAADAVRAEEAAKAAQEIAQGALGYYETPEILREEHPSAEAGNWCIVGSTDTIWVWDTDEPGWTDTGNKTDLSQYYTKDEMADILAGITPESIEALPLKGGTLTGYLWVNDAGIATRKNGTMLIHIASSSTGGSYSTNMIDGSEAVRVYARETGGVVALAGPDTPLTDVLSVTADGKIRVKAYEYVGVSALKTYHLTVSSNLWQSCEDTWNGISATQCAQFSAEGALATDDVISVLIAGGDAASAGQWDYCRVTDGMITLYATQAPTAEFELQLSLAAGNGGATRNQMKHPNTWVTGTLDLVPSEYTNSVGFALEQVMKYSYNLALGLLYITGAWGTPNLPATTKSSSSKAMVPMTDNKYWVQLTQTGQSLPEEIRPKAPIIIHHCGGGNGQGTPDLVDMALRINVDGSISVADEGGFFAGDDTSSRPRSPMYCSKMIPI